MRLAEKLALARRLLPASFVITGPPVVQKNSKRILKRKSGVRFIASNASVLAWKESAVYQLRAQWRGRETIPAGINMRASLAFYLGAGQRPDLDGLLAAPLDALEAAGIVSNDYWVSELEQCARYRSAACPRIEIALRLAKVRGGRLFEASPGVC